MRCRIVMVDGQPVRVQGDAPATTEAGQAALTEVVRAAREYAASLPPAPISVPCTDCAAQRGEFCRNAAGNITSAHEARRRAVAQ